MQTRGMTDAIELDRDGACVWNQSTGNAACIDNVTNITLQYHGVVDVATCSSHFCVLVDFGAELACTGAVVRVGLREVNPLSPNASRVHSPYLHNVKLPRSTVNATNAVVVGWGVDVRTPVESDYVSCGPLETCVDDGCFGYTSGVFVPGYATFIIGTVLSVLLWYLVRRHVWRRTLAVLLQVIVLAVFFSTIPILFSFGSMVLGCCIASLCEASFGCLRAPRPRTVLPEDLEELRERCVDREEGRSEPESGLFRISEEDEDNSSEEDERSVVRV